MNRQDKQRKIEISVFKEFVKFCLLEIVSFDSKDPPEPDILCELKNGNKLAFELVEAVDHNQARQHDLSISVKQEMRQYYESLSGSSKNNFNNLYGNADLFFKFGDDLTKNKILNNLPEIFTFLLSLDEKSEGNIKNTTPNFPNVCKKIRINRGCFIGPMFNISNAMYIKDGVTEALSSKFNKAYSCSYPIELIIHSDTRPLLPSTLWIDEVKGYIKENLLNSPFRRVWVFGLHEMKIEYVFPSVESQS